MCKQIAALLLAVVLLLCGSIPVCALIAVEDENGNIRYSTDPVEDKPKPISAVKQWAQNALQKVKQYWHRHGVLTIALLLVVCILGTVVVLTVEDEKKKQKALESRPKKKRE